MQPARKSAGQLSPRLQDRRSGINYDHWLAESNNGGRSSATAEVRLITGKNIEVLKWFGTITIPQLNRQMGGHLPSSRYLTPRLTALAWPCSW